MDSNQNYLVMNTVRCQLMAFARNKDSFGSRYFAQQAELVTNDHDHLQFPTTMLYDFARNQLQLGTSLNIMTLPWQWHNFVPRLP